MRKEIGIEKEKEMLGRRPKKRKEKKKKKEKKKEKKKKKRKKKQTLKKSREFTVRWVGQD